MAAAFGPDRGLLAAQAVSLPRLTGSGHTDATGKQCEQARLNSTADFLNSTWFSINCINTYTVDSQIFLTMYTTAAVGLLCLAVFCWGQSFVSVYRGRLLSPHVALKPPVFNKNSFLSKYFLWLWVTIALKETDLLATAGMDALMFERLIVFGLQFMLPVTVVAMCTLIPIHTASKFFVETLDAQQIAKTNLITLTMGNLQPGANTLWVHFFLVILFTCYGMWLLDQHYKSYVLLRQQYLTRGDSVSTWLGSTPKQRPMASHASVLAADLSKPMWTFARAKVTDMEPAASAPASMGSPMASVDADGAGPDGGPDGRQQGPVLSKLGSLQSRGSDEGQQQQQHEQRQRRHPQQLRAHALQSLEEAPLRSSSAAGMTPAPAPSQAVVSPFAGYPEEDALQQGDTLQMVQLTDIIFTAPSGRIEMEEEWSVASPEPQQAAASQVNSPSESSSAPGSTLVSRQSSTRALLATKNVDSSHHSEAAQGPPAPQQQAAARRSLPFQRHSRGGQAQQLQPQPLEGDAALRNAQQPHDLDSADGGARRKGGRRFAGCGGCVGCGSTDDSAAQAPAVSFAADENTRRRQATAGSRAAQVAPAARAGQELGADVEWWQFKTGDLLLDRHIVRVDMDQELHEAGEEDESTSRPYFWWDLAPSAACSTSGSGSCGSNMQPVRGTSLLFDRRSLRTRRPSVRFRNTVHVRAHDGSLVPLHVSNYAVLVTDVPDPGRASRNGSCDVDFGPSLLCWQPWEHCCGVIFRMLDSCLQYLNWCWPCLLSRAELLQFAKDWGHVSLKSTQSMVILDQAYDASLLEEGALLAKSTQEPSQQPSLEDRQQQRSRWRQWREQQEHRQAAFQSRAFDRPCFNRRRLVELTFRHLFPGDVQAVIPAQEYKALNELMREWNRKVQAYMFTAALLDLKHQKQERKAQRELKKAAAKAAADAASAQDGGDTTQGSLENGSRQQVCIEVTSMQQRVAAKQTAAGSGRHTDAAGPGGELASGVEVATGVAAHASSSTDSRSTAAGPDDGSNGCQPAVQQPGMVRANSGDSFGLESSDNEDDQLGCCSRVARGMCCCCGMTIQERVAEEVEGRDGAAAGGSPCCRLFRRRAQPHSEISSSVLDSKRKEILELEQKILEAQREVRASPDTGNFIVLFKSPRAASLAANSTVYPHAGSVEAFKVQPAPNPEDVLWPSLWASPEDRRAVLWKCVFWYGILYAVPTGFFTAALNGVALMMCSTSTPERGLAWFCAQDNMGSRFLQFLVTIVAPFILLMVWQNAVIPAQLYRLELRRAVAVSLSQMERRLLLTYCGWELVNIFLGGVLSGSIVTQLQQFVRHPETWAQILGSNIPQTSNYFLNYVIMRAFMMNFVRLLMPHGGMWRWLGQMLFTGFASFKHAATAAYRARIIYPASIRYGREPGLVLLILMIGMAYCVAAPLMTVFVLAYMVTAYITWRYQIIYVCTRAYESGGKMWPTYFLCLTYCLGFFVAFTSSMLIFKKGNIQGVVVLLLLPVLYLFNRRCRFRYCAKVDHPPLWLTHMAPRSEIDPLVYTPPCMQPNAQGWFFEAGKPWVRWGVPSYNNPKGEGHDAGGCCC